MGHPVLFMRRHDVSLFDFQNRPVQEQASSVEAKPPPTPPVEQPAALIQTPQPQPDGPASTCPTTSQ